ncbi:MAG: hypothetical protein QOG62_2708 [Thermoleophilaceae bacterium]|jgi:hypothetical protein|nr:hypothetical protein [Thermoleophilaceae bacterium]
MRRLIAGSLVAACVSAPTAVAATPAPAGPWDGKRPFACKMQDVGSGTGFQDPAAEPFCVKFDKTHQNISQLGIADFVLKEPARVAAAVNKCQYFQKDHWTGRIVQDQAGSEVYNFSGRYYFDKSSGAGGAFIKNLRVLGQKVDPSSYPGIPAAFKPYFTKNGGGAHVDFKLPGTPLCTAGEKTASAVASRQAAAADDYYTTPTTPTKPKPDKRCPNVKGKVSSKGIGKAKIGAKAGDIKRALGAPGKTGADLYRYCTTTSGGRLVIGFRGTTSAYVGTNVEKVKLDGVSVGDKTSDAEKKLKKVKQEGSLLLVKDGKANLVLATKGKTIESVGVADSKLSGSLLKKFANQSG